MIEDIMNSHDCDEEEAYSILQAMYAYNDPNEIVYIGDDKDE